LEGVEAVIDKDFTSALLAEEMEIEQLIILTAVDHVYINFKSENPTALEKVTMGEVEQHLRSGEFAEGSMKPKIEAALRFLKHGGTKVVIAHLNDLLPAVHGETGTHIVPN
jgi:carbamate kinase